MKDRGYRQNPKLTHLPQAPKLEDDVLDHLSRLASDEIRKLFARDLRKAPKSELAILRLMSNSGLSLPLRAELLSDPVNREAIVNPDVLSPLAAEKLRVSTNNQYDALNKKFTAITVAIQKARVDSELTMLSPQTRAKVFDKLKRNVLEQYHSEM